MGELSVLSEKLVKKRSAVSLAGAISAAAVCLSMFYLTAYSYKNSVALRSYKNAGHIIASKDSAFANALLRQVNTINALNDSAALIRYSISNQFAAKDRLKKVQVRKQELEKSLSVANVSSIIAAEYIAAELAKEKIAEADAISRAARADSALKDSELRLAYSEARLTRSSMGIKALLKALEYQNQALERKDGLLLRGFVLPKKERAKAISMAIMEYRKAESLGILSPGIAEEQVQALEQAL